MKTPQQDPFDSLRGIGPNIEGTGGRLGPRNILPDSGVRTEFATGAVRENKAGKGRFADIPPCALHSLARRFQDGEPTHGRGNWMKGIPLSSYQDATNRHTLAAAQGHTDEDHFGAALWNLACWQWTEQEIEAGRLPKSLDDLPFRRPLERNEYGSLSGGPTRSILAQMDRLMRPGIPEDVLPPMPFNPDALQILKPSLGSLSGGPTEKEMPL
jgi:hypothetical protein